MKFSIAMLLAAICHAAATAMVIKMDVAALLETWLVNKILHAVEVTNGEFKDNYDLLHFLVNRGKLTAKEAEQVSGIDILGLSNRRHGILAKLVNLDTTALSDADIANEKQKLLKISKNGAAAAVAVLDGGKGSLMEEDGDVVHVDADADL
ncbi:hypothetical protein VHEMI10302 [[Torrubiella] hemipterigena]|uniref:Uncharacterized protein n=1 Tax=[Torrubiella] hemipterigena TaxID=1531966 RepID=A0A0A1TRM9_9HYPO|nr:hypothetical protein VHEMI10302 [[Torrubiella] hemipterigena]